MSRTTVIWNSGIVVVFLALALAAALRGATPIDRTLSSVVLPFVVGAVFAAFGRGWLLGVLLLAAVGVPFLDVAGLIDFPLARAGWFLSVLAGWFVGAMIGQQRGQRGTTPGVGAKRRRGNVLVILMLSAMALVTVVILGGSWAWKAYDRSHVISVTCTVTGAEGDVGSSTSGKGIGSSFDEVAIMTKECGPLILRRGVTADNKDAIAAKLEAGGSTRFQIGEASFRYREALVRLREGVIVFGLSEEP